MRRRSPQGLVACDERVARMATQDFFEEQDCAAKKVHGVPDKLPSTAAEHCTPPISYTLLATPKAPEPPAKVRAPSPQQPAPARVPPPLPPARSTHRSPLRWAQSSPPCTQPETLQQWRKTTAGSAAAHS